MLRSRIWSWFYLTTQLCYERISNELTSLNIMSVSCSTSENRLKVSCLKFRNRRCYKDWILHLYLTLSKVHNILPFWKEEFVVSHIFTYCKWYNNLSCAFFRTQRRQLFVWWHYDFGSMMITQLTQCLIPQTLRCSNGARQYSNLLILYLVTCGNR